jgi:two-component system sensor histidine kinase HydH
MTNRIKGLSRYAIVPALLALPLILLVSSLLTFRELHEMQAVYLRNRAATIAARLENVSPEQQEGQLLEFLSTEEPALVDLRIYQPGEKDAESPVLESLWNGTRLFHTEELTRNGDTLFRAYIPFHMQSQLRVARIDLAANAADFLLVHARHNILVSLLSSVTLILFAIYFVWSGRRTARLERRQLELQHLAHLGKMSAVLAHEIRNPLGTIKGFAQLAEEQAGENVRALLTPVLGETARLEKLVNDLLLYGGPREPRKQPASWEQLASQLQIHAAEAIGDRPIRFELNGNADSMETDPDLLLQVLLNLVRNSVEAFGDSSEGEVRLVSRRLTNGGLAISVEDNGPGIPEGVRAKLFQPFITTKANGTGLGLSIARKLTEALGGRLEITPLAPHGTRARLVFP